MSSTAYNPLSVLIPKTQANELRFGLLPSGLDDGRLEGFIVRTHDLTDPLTLLEQDEGRHGADGEIRRHIGHLVDVNFEEAHVGVDVRHPVGG